MQKVIFIVLFLITTIAFSQELNCSDFKNGTFTYTDPDYADLLTTRTDSIQIDTYPKLDLEMTSTVTWLSDCKYQMVYTKVNDPKMEAIIGIKYVIEIIEINDNKIICQTVSEGIIVKKEMIKLK